LPEEGSASAKGGDIGASGHQFQKSPAYGDLIHDGEGIVTPPGLLSSARCTNPNTPWWRIYGGAAVPVQICDGLREFTGFLSVLGERPEGTTLSRFGDIGGYSCGQCEQCKRNGWELNCEWGTPKQQASEQRVKRQLAFLAA